MLIGRPLTQPKDLFIPYFSFIWNSLWPPVTIIRPAISFEQKFKSENPNSHQYQISRSPVSCKIYVFLSKTLCNAQFKCINMKLAKYYCSVRIPQPQRRGRDHFLTSRERITWSQDLKEKKNQKIENRGTLEFLKNSLDIINQFGIHFQDFYDKSALLLFIRWWEFLRFLFLRLLCPKYPLGGDIIIFFLGLGQLECYDAL